MQRIPTKITRMTQMRRLSTGPLIITIIISVALVLCYCSIRCDAVLFTCSGGAITFLDVNLGTVEFDSTASNCAITIRSCRADSLFFLAATTNMVLVVRDVVATEATVAGSFLRFSGAVTGGSISVDGITGTIRGSSAAAAGLYTIVRFDLDVTAIRFMSITRINITTAVSAAGEINLYPVYALASVGGDSTPGSNMNVSANLITAGSTWTTSGGTAQVFLFYVREALTGFYTFEMSSNSIAGITVRGSGGGLARVFFVLVSSEIALIGVALFRDNSARGVSVSAVNSTAQLMLFHSPFQGRNRVAVAAIVVDGIDMGACSVTSVTSAVQIRLVLLVSANLSTSAIHISNVFIGGTAFAATTTLANDGVKLLDLQSANSGSGTRVVRMTDSSIDLRFTVAGTSVNASIIDILHTFSLTTLTMSNCTIKGSYASSGGGSGSSTISLYIFRAQRNFSATTLSIVNCGVFTSTQVQWRFSARSTAAAIPSPISCVVIAAP